jgi:hypothetical protein
MPALLLMAAALSISAGAPTSVLDAGSADHAANAAAPTTPTTPIAAPTGGSNVQGPAAVASAVEPRDPRIAPNLGAPLPVAAWLWLGPARAALAAAGPAERPESSDRVEKRARIAYNLQRVEPAAATPIKPAAPTWRGTYNLYRKAAFVTQRDFKWCVAASVQMMVNIVRHRHDRTMATQKRMIAFAQASDHGPWGPGGGTDVTGWIAALRHFGAGKYRAVGTRTPAEALRIAAIAMRQTGRPAGMLVMDGRHAWILHGFESRSDPLRGSRATITSVRVSGPLYPIQQKDGYDLHPNIRLSVRTLARYFHPSSVGALVGKYVVIVPAH